MNRPLVLGAIVSIASLTGLTGCASKSVAPAPEAGRFRIVSIGPEDGKTIALLDSETGCMWEYHASDSFSPTEYFGGIGVDTLPVGRYPDTIPPANNHLSDQELDALPLKNLDEQIEDCDAVHYRAVQEALGKKPSR